MGEENKGFVLCWSASIVLSHPPLYAQPIKKPKAKQSPRRESQGATQPSTMAKTFL